MSGDVVSLNRARKARDKADRVVTAAQNRIRFGRTKTQKAQAAVIAQRADQILDGKKREH